MSHSVVMQSAGHGFRLRTSVLRREMLKSATLLQGVHDAIYMQMCSFAQAGACNGMHEVEPRLSRWLLHASDLMETETMDFTQEFLSLMLGTQRTSVSIAAGTLQRRGLISYQRGHVTILNRPLMEHAACDCYTMLREVYQRTFPDKSAR
ncbi:MAG: Crp/Fnr family transcriptional regulator [Janthinobacterium lividum]